MDHGRAGGNAPPSETLDAKLANVLAERAQSVSRRGFLSKVGSVLLFATGAATLPELLPATRGVAVAGHKCANDGPGHWYRCGQYGYKCNCCNASGNSFDCPNCARFNGFWTGCCENLNGNCRIVRYWDCMSVNGSCSRAKIDACNNCHFCKDAPPQPVWSSYANAVYMCTIVDTTGTACSGC